MIFRWRNLFCYATASLTIAYCTHLPLYSKKPFIFSTLPHSLYLLISALSLCKHTLTTIISNSYLTSIRIAKSIGTRHREKIKNASLFPTILPARVTRHSVLINSFRAMLAQWRYRLNRHYDGNYFLFQTQLSNKHRGR